MLLVLNLLLGLPVVLLIIVAKNSSSRQLRHSMLCSLILGGIALIESLLLMLLEGSQQLSAVDYVRSMGGVVAGLGVGWLLGPFLVRSVLGKRYHVFAWQEGSRRVCQEHLGVYSSLEEAQYQFSRAQSAATADEVALDRAELYVESADDRMILVEAYRGRWYKP